jgi:threonine synthase
MKIRIRFVSGRWLVTIPKTHTSANHRPFQAAAAAQNLVSTTGNTSVRADSTPDVSTTCTMETSNLVAQRNLQRLQRHDSILQTIGSTPIVKLHKISPRGRDVNVYVKLESENPGGSIKDRLAYGVIEWAEKHGELKPGQTVIDASSGNTGKSNEKKRVSISTPTHRHVSYVHFLN